MILSVIIVNYNVKYFLEQALLAVQNASQGLDVEVFVVDNQSTDGSVEMVREQFPDVKLIANDVNVGFSTANNQAIKISKGKYVLLLNPDTVVREDTFRVCIDFMEKHPDAGGLGVKMIDGTGAFLPESKRGFPSPEVAFYKTFGLSKLFPKSRRFNKYHLGYLSKEENHEVDVLSGAFMLMPRQVLEEIGYLDETFFMYGEDIDLSYRIIKGGYKNYYCADTTIIHYKGESTKKGSLNYVKTFYNAMIIFTQKHFQGNQASLFVQMLRLAIYLRALITLCTNFARKTYLMFLDGLLIFIGLLGLKDMWELIRFDDPHYYDFYPALIRINFPIYVFTWVVFIYLNGAYDQFSRKRHLFFGVLTGSVAIAVIYGFLPQELRSSRMLILLGMLWAAVATFSLRVLLSFLRHKTLFTNTRDRNNVVVVGDEEEGERILKLLYKAHFNINYIGLVSVDEAEGSYIGHIENLEEIAHIYKVNELIFCSKNVKANQVMYWMEKLGLNCNYKMLPAQSNNIIGSNSKNAAGDIYTVDINYRIAFPVQRRQKRLLDIGICLVLLVLSPLLFIFQKEKAYFFINIFQVLFKRKTLVGYQPVEQANIQLPKLSKGVLSPLDSLKLRPQESRPIQRINLFYAKDYSVSDDLDILFKAWRFLGRKSL